MLAKNWEEKKQWNKIKETKNGAKTKH